MTMNNKGWMLMKKMTVVALLAGVAVVGSAVWAADGGWFDGWFGKKEATTASAPAKSAAPAATVAAGNALDIQATDRVLGSMTAPVTIVEYASMTCSHCADFATKTMPQVKKDWINTGKAKYVLRDLAWDNLAVGMAKVARCAPASKFMPLADAFFANQMTIVTSNEPLAEIKKVAATYGMDSAKVEECVKDADLQAQVEASKDTAMNQLGVRGTPAVFVNGVKVDGAVDYAELKKTLDAAYAKTRGTK